MTFALFSSCENTPNLFELRFFSSYREEEEDDAEIRKFPVIEEVSFYYSMQMLYIASCSGFNKRFHMISLSLVNSSWSKLPLEPIEFMFPLLFVQL